jgi:hypothetical protein
MPWPISQFSEREKINPLFKVWDREKMPPPPPPHLTGEEGIIDIVKRKYL